MVFLSFFFLIKKNVVMCSKFLGSLNGYKIFFGLKTNKVLLTFGDRFKAGGININYFINIHFPIRQNR